MVVVARPDLQEKLSDGALDRVRRAYGCSNRRCLPKATLVVVWVLGASAGSLGSSRRALAAEVVASGSPAVVTLAEPPAFAIDVRLLGGGAALSLTQTPDSSPYTERYVGDAAAATFGAGLQWGWFAGPCVQLGLAHSIVRYQWLGHYEVSSVSIDQKGYWDAESAYTVYSPLGVFVELRPGLDAAVFLNLSGSLGYIPSVEGQGGTILMAGFAIEVGHELGSVTKDGLGVFLRYANWAGTENPLHTDFPAGLTSHELTLGVRWSFEHPTITD